MIGKITDRVIALVIFSFFYLISMICFSCAEGSSNNRKQVRNIYGVVGIFIICLLAGLRSETVGTDVLVYAKPIYESASSTNKFANLLLETGNEFIYYIIAFIVSNVFNSFQVFLFILELLVACPIYLSAVKNRNNGSIAITMLLFLLLYYPMTFNIMRQSISASWLILAFVYLKNNKWIRSIIVSFVGVLFHSSGIIGIVLLLTCYLISNIKTKRKRIIFLLLIGVLGGIIVSNIEMIANWLIYEKKILPESYGYYLNIFLNNGSGLESSKDYFFSLGKYGIVSIVFRVVLFFVPAILLRKDRKLSKELRVYYYISLISFLIFIFSYLIWGTSYSYRITIFLEFINILYFAEFITKKIKNNHRWTYTSQILLLVAILYCLFVYFGAGDHGIIPYYFYFL